MLKFMYGRCFLEKHLFFINVKLHDERSTSFQTAMVMQNEREKYDQTKWIYVPDFYTDYRYILGTVGNNPLITIGINPSTAEPEKMDNTMKSVERIAKGNGIDSFIMFNVYAQRASDPNQMNKEINPMLHKENMQAFQWILENSGKKPIIWAAWGTNIERRTYLKECLREMINISNRYNAVWCKVGKCSVKGHPHHPLYLKKDSRLETFDVKTYLTSL